MPVPWVSAIDHSAINGAWDRAMTVRGLSLYGPVMLALLLAFGRRREPRLMAGVLLGVLWTMPALLAVQHVNLVMGWWSFQTAGPAFQGMPVELYLGWCCLWGAVPPLAFRRVPLGWGLAAMGLLDVAMMPLCRPVVMLDKHWLAGEVLALAAVLLPGMLLARWTFQDRRLRARAALQAATAGGVFLFLPPEIVFALRGGGWADIALHGWRLGLAIQVLFALALPGLSAIQEFVGRGGGTPIPYDPPNRLVVSGIYRYVANPMQISCTLVMLAWGLLLRSSLLAGAGMISAVYSAGIAHWDEGEDLKARFGVRWIEFRLHVRDWRVRGTPYAPGQQARLYLASECAPCSELRCWFAARPSVGLQFKAAEEYPGEALRRIRYVPGDGGAAEDGLRAVARGLEHMHLGWALIGMAMRLPGLRWVLQMVADGVGFGERVLGAGRLVTEDSKRRRIVTPSDAGNLHHL